MHAIERSGMRHDVKGKVERASPDVLNFGVAQPRITAKHALAQTLGTFSHRPLRFRKKCGASAEEHAVVRGESVVIEKMLGVVDHAVARAQFARQARGQRLRGNDVRADGNYFFRERWRSRSGV